MIYKPDMPPLLDLTEENFDAETEKHEMMILDFWAPWCGPCKLFAPVFAAAAGLHPQILFGRIDSDAQPTLSKQFDIFSVPTLIAAKKDTIFFARPGSLTDVKLAKLIAELSSWKPPED